MPTPPPLWPLPGGKVPNQGNYFADLEQHIANTNDLDARLKATVDTGLRDISAMLAGGVTGTVKIQRVGREVTMIVANLTVPTARWLTLSGGWLPIDNNVGAFAVLREYVATGGYYVLQPFPDGFGGATQLLTGAGAAVASSRLQGQIKWTAAAAPPGTPYIGT